jgi:hypothetical protein
MNLLEVQQGLVDHRYPWHPVRRRKKQPMWEAPTGPGGPTTTHPQRKHGEHCACIPGMKVKKRVGCELQDSPWLDLLWYLCK